MDLTGTFGVSPNGGATYSIPIELPPGTGGVQPALSLSYGTQGGNGLVGVGWALAGISSITRCPATIATEGGGTGVVNSAITYTGSDPFCLDGAKLVATHGVYGADQTQYRTELETFSKIISYGSSGTVGGSSVGPAYFKVWTRSGEVLEFGNTASSKAIAAVPGNSGVTAVRAWMVDAVTSPQGNYFTVTYCAASTSCSQSPTSGSSAPNSFTTGAEEVVPLEIDYTGNAAQSLTPYNKVKFVYSPRTDTSITYQAGSGIASTQILSQIQAYANSSLITAYSLLYQQSTATKRSEINSITRCGYDGSGNATCLPATTFQYQATGALGQIATAASSVTGSTDTSSEWRAYPGDFNGDGRTDILWVSFGGGILNGNLGWADGNGALIWYSNGDGTFTPGPSLTYLPFKNSWIWVGDQNGDGRADILIGNLNGNWSTAFANPDNQTFTLESQATVWPGTCPGGSCQPIYGQTYVAEPIIADFRGNGRADILFTTIVDQSISTGGITNFFLNNGPNSASDPTITFSSSTVPINAPYSNYNTYVGDFNGDGKQDLLVIEMMFPSSCTAALPTGRMSVGLSNGDGSFTWKALTNHPGYMPFIGDFNGDGKTDILLMSISSTCYSDVTSWASGTWLLLTSQGDGTFNTITTPFGAEPAYVNYQPTIADFNGDGRADVLLIAQNQPPGNVLLLSQADGSWISDTTDVVLTSGIPGTQGGRYFPVVADFNGDGKADILWDRSTQKVPGEKASTPGWSSGADPIYLSDGVQPDLLTLVTTGLGATTNVSYSTLGNGNAPYSEGNSAVFPTTDSGGSIPIVVQTQTDNGIGGLYTNTYQYAGAQTDVHGRGFLGFTNVTQTDAQTGITSSTSYRRDYPFAGMASGKTITCPKTTCNGSSASVTVENISYSYGALVDNNLVSFIDGGNSNPTHQFPYLWQSVTTKTDLDGHSVLPTVTVTNGQSLTAPTEGDYDSYGNLIRSNTQSTDTTLNPAQTWTVATANTFGPDSIDWCIGDLTKLQVTATGPSGSSQTRTTSRSYSVAGSTSPLPCLVTADIVEPTYTTAGNHIYHEVDYGYQGNGYGERTSTTVMGYDATSTTSTVVQLASTATTWDSKGQFPTATLTPTGNNNVSLSSNSQYDPRFGGILTATDANSLQTTTSYDTLGRTSKIVHPDGTYETLTLAYCSSSPSSCAALGSYTITKAFYGSNGTQSAPTEVSVYDRLNRQITAKQTSFGGGTTNVVQTVYDALGRVYQVSRPYLGSSPSSAVYTTNTYDPLGRLTLSVGPDGAKTKVAFHGLSQTITNADGQTKTTLKNGAGWVSSVTNSLANTSQNTTTYSYSPFGDLLTVTDPAGNVVSYSYDQRGRKIGMVEPDEGTWSYTPNSLGQLIAQATPHENGSGLSTTMTYDGIGRMTNRTEPGFSPTPEMSSTWIYDTCSNGFNLLCSAATYLNNASTTSYSRIHKYDSLSRPAETDLVLDANSGKFVTKSLYDVAGRLSQVTNPDGSILTTVYNAAGYASSRKLTAPGASTATVVATINTENAALQVTQATSGDGYVTNNTFDPNTGRLTAVASGSTPWLWMGYDPIGNLNWRQDSVNKWAEAFTYDGLGRLCTSESVAISTNPANTPPTPTAQTVSATAACAAQPTGYAGKSFTYDALGNILSKSDVGSYSYSTTYPHRVTKISVGTGTVFAAGDMTYSYGSDGDMTTGDAAITGDGTRTYTWNAADMVYQIKVTGDSVVYAYGPEHQRISMTDTPASGNATTTYYVRLGADRVELLASTGEWHDDASLNGAPTAEYNSKKGAVLYLHPDHLHSTAAVTGATSESDSYDAWGRRRCSNGTDDPTDQCISSVDVGYSGQEHSGGAPLALVGLVNLNARFYDTTIGRFISLDPIGLAGGANPYAYANNNPLKYTDRTGMAPERPPYWVDVWGTRPVELESTKPTVTQIPHNRDNFVSAPAVQATGLGTVQNSSKQSSFQAAIAGVAGMIPQLTDALDEYQQNMSLISTETFIDGGGPEDPVTTLIAEAEDASAAGAGLASLEIKGSLVIGEEVGKAVEVVVEEGPQLVDKIEEVVVTGAKEVGGAAAEEAVPVIEMSASRFGQAAEHIADAQAAGQPSILTIDRLGADAKRAAATGGMPKVPGMQLDEYPPAMFSEGGAGASVRAINPADNMSAGSYIGNCCRPFPNGSQVQIKVVP